MIEKGKRVIEQAVDKGLIPGAAFGYLTDELEEYDFYGYASLIPEKKELSLDFLYDMASLSKVVVTTTLILKLIEEGYFALDICISDILKDMPFSFTIKELLTHTSGLPGDDKKYRECKDKNEIYEFCRNLKLQNEPGKIVDYSDFGFIILGYVIERYKGNLETYAKEIIFDPLGMNNAMYNPALKGYRESCAPTELSEKRGLIQGEVHDGKAFIMGGVSGNAGLFCNVKDVGRFVRMILDGGQGILNRDSVSLFRRNYTENLNLNRTLGWCLASEDYANGHHYSNETLFHTGFSGTSIYIDLKQRIGIILLCNRVHPSRDNPYIVDIRNAFHDALLS